MSSNKSQVVLITGASSGMGFATAKQLASVGYHVFASMRGIAGRNEKSAAALRDWAVAAGVRLEVVEIDVTDEAQVNSCIADILDRAGRIDVVVSNAGVGAMGLVEAFTIEQHRQIFDINCLGHVRVDRAVLPSMRARGSGLLLHVSSVSGRVAMPFCGPYSGAKAALEMIIENMSEELAPFGVDCISLEPGGYATEGLSKGIEAADRERIASYGDRALNPEVELAGLGRQLTTPGSNDVREVSEAIETLIAMPPGHRPLRTVVGRVCTAGIETVNEAVAVGRRKMIESYTLAAAEVE